MDGFWTALTGIGTILLAAVAALQDVIRGFVGRPRMEVIYEHEPPFFRRSGRLGAGNNPLGDFFDFHIRIRNRSRWQRLRNVEAILENLCRYDPTGKANKIAGFWTIRLRYDNRGTRMVDINPGRHEDWNLAYIPNPVALQAWLQDPKYVDVPGAVANAHRLYLDVADFPFHQPNCLVPGEYAVQVSVYAENAQQVDKFYRITWKGN